MSGDMMPKEQYDFIEGIQDYMIEASNMTESQAWDFGFRIWQFRKWLCEYMTIEVSEDYESILDWKIGVIPCEDAISRANLLSELRRDAERVEMEEFANDTVWRTIGNAPSVIPKPKEGEWIKQFKGTKCVCSICGYSNGRKHNDNYCPNCGSRMKGAE